MAGTVISAHGLGKQYRIWTHAPPQSLSDRVSLAVHRRRRSGREVPLKRTLWALRNVSFEVDRGEVLGVVGPNGAGKSTLLEILAGITDPTEGRARIHGRVSSLLEVGTGFHPELSGRDNVFLNGAILGMSRRETVTKFDEIVDFSGVRDFIDMPIKRYSTGMSVRLAFAVAAHLDPEILLLDEVLTVGDRAFQEKCVARINEITKSGRTVVFVSHDVSSVARLCNRGVLLNNGSVAYQGDIDETISRYLSSKSLGSAESDENVGHSGSGEIRIEHIKVTADDGTATVRAELPVKIRVVLRARPGWTQRRLRLQLGVDSMASGRHVLLSTDFDPSLQLEDVGFEGTTVVVCRLQNLPLKPGTYVVGASIEEPGGELLDSVTEQARFAIVPSDFFGTGVMPSEHHIAPTLVRHHWEVYPEERDTRLVEAHEEASV